MDVWLFLDLTLKNSVNWIHFGPLLLVVGGLKTIYIKTKEIFYDVQHRLLRHVESLNYL
jgi:hypothetical protein